LPVYSSPGHGSLFHLPNAHGVDPSGSFPLVEVAGLRQPLPLLTLPLGTCKQETSDRLQGFAPDESPFTPARTKLTGGRYPLEFSTLSRVRASLPESRLPDSSPHVLGASLRSPGSRQLGLRDRGAPPGILERFGACAFNWSPEGSQQRIHWLQPARGAKAMRTG